MPRSAYESGWVEFFREGGAEVAEEDLRVQGWRLSVNVTNIDAFHAIVQLYEQRDLTREPNSLSFKTRKSPDKDDELEWKICILREIRVKEFIEEHGRDYNVV